MDTLNFRPEPFAGWAAKASGCGCSACQHAARPDELELDDEAEPSCSRCGRPRADYELDAPETSLVDGVLARPSARSFGKVSSKKNPAFTTKRCVGGKSLACPTLTGLEDVTQVDGVGFEYIGGWENHKGLIFGKTVKKWLVVEANRKRNRTLNLLPHASAGIATFIANMRAINLPIEAILSMGGVYCRCVSNTTHLSNHSYGDAVDIGGVRFVGGREVLEANSECDAADRALLHRINACLRLSFATVFDYHDRKRHKDHFHCDTNQNRGRNFGPGWAFVRESLGLAPKGGFNKACANALRQFAGSADAVKDAPTLSRTLSQLFQREASRAAAPRPPRYACHNTLWVR